MSTQNNLFKDFYLYGAQFYRPPNPPADQRMKDLENIKKLGYNFIKIFAEWNWINHHEGVYEFDELIEIIKKSRELDINIVINARLEQAPYWAAEKYPDSRYVNARGRKIELQARSNTPTGGWPGLCFDHQGVKEDAEIFMIQIAKELGNYDNVKIIDCWNEPHIAPYENSDSVTIGDFLFCYCPHTVTKYREWLEQRYSTIENINNKWYRRYRNFTDINPPRRLMDYVDMMEWRKFMTWSMSDKMTWRYRTFRNNLPPDTVIMSHPGGHGITNGYGLLGCDDYELSKDLDLFGLTLNRRFNAFDFCCELDIVKSSSRNKKCLNLELLGGQYVKNATQNPPSGLSRSQIPKRNNYRLWNFADVAFGMKGIMYWQYRGEMLGEEAPGFGLVKRDGSFTERSDETSRICRFLNTYPELFNNFASTKNKTAIVILRDSYYFNFAAEGNETYSSRSAKGVYRFLLKNNVGPDFLVEEMLEDQIFDYELIYLVMPFVIDSKTADILKKYVENGGIIFSDCALGIFNRYGVSSEIVPSCGLNNLFGASQDELRQFDLQNIEEIYQKDFKSFDYVIEKIPDIYFKGTNKLTSYKIKMTTFLENFSLDGAEPIFEHEDKIVATLNVFGKGKAYLFGTSVGQSLFLGDRDTEEALLRILDIENIKHHCKDDLIIKDLKGNNLGAIIIINPNRVEIKQSISMEKEIKIIESFNSAFQYNLSRKSLSFKIDKEDANCLVYEYI